MTRTDSEQMCPSAQPTSRGARVFGVQVGTGSDDGRVAYLTETYAVTEEFLALAGSALPTEVLRIAAPCVRCSHHDGTGCRLATRVATMLDPVVGAMPRCAIRPNCLWFRQEGKDACLRCPQVKTIKRAPSAFDQSVGGLPAQDPESLPVVSRPPSQVAPVAR